MKKYGIRGVLVRPSKGRQSSMERFHPPLTILWLGSCLLVGLLPSPGLDDPIFTFNLLKEWSKMPTLLLLDSGEGEFPLSFQFSVHLFWWFSNFFRVIYVEQVTPNNHRQWRGDCWLVWSLHDEQERMGCQSPTKANVRIRKAVQRLETEGTWELCLQQD